MYTSPMSTSVFTRESKSTSRCPSRRVIASIACPWRRGPARLSSVVMTVVNMMRKTRYFERPMYRMSLRTVLPKSFGFSRIIRPAPGPLASELFFFIICRSSSAVGSSSFCSFFPFTGSSGRGAFSFLRSFFRLSAITLPLRCSSSASCRYPGMPRSSSSDCRGCRTP